MYSHLTAFTMSNGAKVGDWLGTAGASCQLALQATDKARAAVEASDQSYYIDTALEAAKQAVAELQAIYNATHA